jgi:hypothetical protein
MKKQQTKKSKPRLRIADRDPRAAAPLHAMAPGLDRLEEALGMAARIAEPYAEEAEAIERVIRFVRGHGRGEPRDIRLTDVLLALSILITATDRDSTPAERELFAFLDALLGVPPRIAPVPMSATVPPYASNVAVPQRPRPFADPYAPVSPFPVISPRLAA